VYYAPRENAAPTTAYHNPKYVSKAAVKLSFTATKLSADYQSIIAKLLKIDEDQVTIQTERIELAFLVEGTANFTAKKTIQHLQNMIDASHPSLKKAGFGKDPSLWTGK
jgi:hypothetical protein